MIRVLLADDHVVVADGLAALLKSRFELAGVVHDGRELVREAALLKPDVIVTDFAMPVLNGIDAAEQILSHDPQARIIVLSVHGEPGLAARAISLGVRGYIIKTEPAERLLEAVQRAYDGYQTMSPELAAGVAQLTMDSSRKRGKHTLLTQRQREVLQLIGEGYTMREAAATLNISPRTAESHKYEIMRQLGAETTAELVRHAVRLRLVEPLGAGEAGFPAMQDKSRRPAPAIARRDLGIANSRPKVVIRFLRKR